MSVMSALQAAMTGRDPIERRFRIQPEAVQPWPNTNMVVVPPGAFLMGDEQKREVRITYPFALGQYPVTFAEWDAALASGAKLERPSDAGWGRNRRPVIYVSWRDTWAYIAWLNNELGLSGRSDAYRLPSEAEWEYACRAGRASPFSTGAAITRRQAQFGAERTAPAGSFPPNAFGLCDMHGNVWEWCQDVWRDDCGAGPFDGSAFETTGLFTERVLRGGSWNGVEEGLRASSRNGDVASARRSWFGFRIARSLGES